MHRKHLEAMGRAPLPPLEAGPGARHTERRPDAAGPAVPQTKHGSGGPARTSHLTAHIKVAGTKHRSAVTPRPRLPQSGPCTLRGELYRK